MASYEDNETAELKRLNAELNESHARCRKVVADCRSQLAANRNVPKGYDDKALRQRRLS